MERMCKLMRISVHLRSIAQGVDRMREARPGTWKPAVVVWAVLSIHPRSRVQPAKNALRTAFGAIARASATVTSVRATPVIAVPTQRRAQQKDSMLASCYENTIRDLLVNRGYVVPELILNGYIY